MSVLRFDDQTVVVTGAGGGLGKAYALFFASRGANIIVNDVGGTLKGIGTSTNPAERVAQEIRDAGGKAVANFDSVLDGEKIIAQAIRHFGSLHVLINNAGVIRDASFKKMKQEDWDTVLAVHLKGAYKCTKAAWLYFRKQKFGRIINTTSAAGLYGNFGQSNYSAAKLGLVGLTKTLALEGEKYNIIANAIAPAAASRMTETILPPDVLVKLDPRWVVPLVAFLCHHHNTQESSGIFEVGAGHIAKLRWERSEGLLLKPDSSLTPSVVIDQWSKAALHKVKFDGKVVLITGAGAGLGRAYALSFAKFGASVVVNDTHDVSTVVSEIKKAGGKAFGVRASALDGFKNVQAAISAFGSIDIIINNAGILRDKSFKNMDDEHWDDVINVHLNATCQICKAAWPYFVDQKYGRILNTTSVSGIYGNFGQANYSTAKAAVIGFSRALAREGARHNIFVNCIAPNAGTTMTQSILPEDVPLALKPEYVAPMALALCSDNITISPSGGLYEVGSGWIAKTRWQRSQGFSFSIANGLSPECVMEKWSNIVDFSNETSDHPESPDDGMRNIMINAGAIKASPPPRTISDHYLQNISKAKAMTAQGTKFQYSDKEVILYALSVGVKEDNLHLVFEHDPNFQVLPTFGVIPFFSANINTPYNLANIVPNFSPARLLHAEQYLEIQGKIPTHGTLTTYPKLLEVIDKEKAAIIRQGFTSVDEHGTVIFYNETTIFVRGCGSFGGPKTQGSTLNAPLSRVK